MRKRALWLALVCVMLLAMILASCGKSAPATTTTTSKATQTQTQTTPTTVKTTTTPTTTSISASTLTAPTTTSAAATPQYGGILRIGDYSLGSVLGNPTTMNSGFSQRQSRPAIETLMRIDKTGAVVPWLAKSWATDAKAMTITLTLNTGISFSDGTPFNASAVKWNLDQDIAAKQTGTNLMKSVTVVNDNTVTINLSQWDNTVVDLLGSSYIGMIVSPTTAQKHDTNWLNANPVGTGPFIFETWIPQVDISYTKNSNYWQSGKPYLDRVDDVIITDQSVGLLNFKAGRTDMFEDPVPTNLPPLLNSYPGFTVMPFASFATTRSGAIFDSANPKSPFSDIRVRQAVQYAINADEMNKALFSGLGQVAKGFVSTDSWGYDSTIIGYPYNPDKAKQLLSDAGYAPGQIKTTFYYQTGSPNEDMALSVQGYLQAVGINLTIVPSIITTLSNYQVKWDGMVAITAVPSPNPAASFAARYIGVDARYFQNMLIPADYKQAVMSAIGSTDFASEESYVKAADKLFTDKYCLAATWVKQPQACVSQAWLHNHGLYTSALASQWTPEAAWKDPGH